MISSKSESICNRSLARLVDSSRNRAFWRGTQIWRPRTQDSLTPLFWSISSDFGAVYTWNVWRSQNRAKFIKTSYFWSSGSGRSRSSMLVPVLVMISSKSVSICNRSHARRANSDKITLSWGVPIFVPSYEGNLLTQRHEICSQETKDSTVKTGSLYQT